MPPPNPDDIADITSFFVEGGTWEQALEDACHAKDYVYFPPGVYPFTGSFDFARLPDQNPDSEQTVCGNKTIFGEGTLVRPDGQNRLLIFGQGGSSGDPTIQFQNITISGLKFDANGFVPAGSMIHWGGDDNLSDILLEKLDFFDSTMSEHPGGIDDWSINIGGFGEMRNCAIRNCSHGINQELPSRHQFLASGFKQDFGQSVPKFALIDGLEISGNMILNGSRSVTISVMANRDSYVQINEVAIFDNVIFNPWRFAISVGFDAADSSDGSPRWLYMKNIHISNNYIEWNREGDEFSSTQGAPGVRIQNGDGFTEDFPLDQNQYPVGIHAVTIERNTIINANHEPKPVIGVLIGGGVNDQPLDVDIANNILPSISMLDVDHSNVLMMGNHVETPNGPPSTIIFGGFLFSDLSDVPVILSPIELQSASMDAQLRFFFHPSDQDMYLMFHDEDNYLKLSAAPNYEMELSIAGNKRAVIQRGILCPGTAYELRIRGQEMADVSNVQTSFRLQGVDEFQTSSFIVPANEKMKISLIGAHLQSFEPLSLSESFRGWIWDVKFSDSISNSVHYTGVETEFKNSAWIDCHGTGQDRNNGILTPMRPYVLFDSHLPVPRSSIQKSLDKLSLEFSFFVSNLEDSPYLFYDSPNDFIQLRPNGSMLLRENGFNRSLLWSGRIKNNRSHVVRIFDSDIVTDNVVLKSELNFTEINAGPEIPIPGPDILESDMQIEFKSFGGKVDSIPNRLQGAVWGIRLVDKKPEPEDEQYEGALRADIPQWQDQLGQNTYLTRNSAILTPYLPFPFTGNAIPVLVNPSIPIAVDLDKLDIRFKIFIEDRSNEPLIFHHGPDSFMRLEDNGQLRIKLNDYAVNICFPVLEEGETYDIRIFNHENRFKVVINGSCLGPQPVIPIQNPDPRFLVSRIGGRYDAQSGEGFRLFKGRIWDVEFRHLGQQDPIVFYRGDFQDPAHGPFEDTTDNPIDMLIQTISD